MAYRHVIVLFVVALFAFSPAAGLATTIYDVQHNETSGDDCYPSPLDAQQVTIEGVVTAVVPGAYPNFWIEEAAGGTWRGVYVYDTTVEPARGDLVNISVEVDEYFGLTELKNVSASQILSSGNDLPAVLDINTGDLNGGCNVTAEAYEGLLVRVSDVTVTQAPDSYGEWYVDDGSGECQLDDVMYEYAATVGDTFDAIVGVVQYSYGEYEILPRDAADLGVTPSDTTNSIYEVQYNETTQGSGDDCFPSPFDNQPVTIEGIVTAVKSGQFPNFWLEDASGGLWQGVYVFDATVGPSRGDRISLTASVDDYFGMTEIKDVTNFEIISTGNTLPDPIDISTVDLAGGCSAGAEAYEGLLVRVSDVVVTQEVVEHGEWYVDDGSGQCQIDDYLFAHTPALGDTFDAIVGVVQYGFGQYEINPRNAEDLGEEPPEPAQSIYDVQYNETSQGTGNDCYPSPHKDLVVTIRGIVTAVLPGEYPNFFLQTPDKGLWSGVFVYDLSVDPDRGDDLAITASVDEYFGLTEIKNVSSFEIHSSDNPMPAPENITTADLAGGCSAGAEAYEGVLVRVNDVSCTTAPNEYGEWFIDDGSGPCQVDDYLYSYAATLGENFPAIVGIVHYSYGEYELLPRDGGDINPTAVNPTAVQDYGQTTPPKAYGLSQNYPNPFNPETEIRYALPEGSYVRLEVFNLLGQKVATLADGPQEGGEFAVRWNGTDDTGLSLASGIYFCRLQAGEFSDTKKMIYLK